MNQEKLNPESLLSEKDHRCPDSSLEITISQDNSNQISGQIGCSRATSTKISSIPNILALHLKIKAQEGLAA